MFVPTVIIFSRKNAEYLLTSGAPPGTNFKYQPSGWISYETFMDWFEHLSQNRLQQIPVLLIVGGHTGRMRYFHLIVKARDRHVAIFCLPPTQHKSSSRHTKHSWHY
jgi:hypothetical protein